jgi:hypothetical protein
MKKSWKIEDGWFIGKRAVEIDPIPGVDDSGETDWVNFCVELRDIKHISQGYIEEEREFSVLGFYDGQQILINASWHEIEKPIRAIINEHEKNYKKIIHQKESN